MGVYWGTKFGVIIFPFIVYKLSIDTLILKIACLIIFAPLVNYLAYFRQNIYRLLFCFLLIQLALST